MKVAIFGGGGFIGGHLGRYLSEHGDDVRGFDLPHATARPEAVFPIDACDVQHDEIALPAGTDAVVYLSQSPHYRLFPRHAGDLFGVNVVGALRVAEAAQRAGVARYCYASSGNVYTSGFEPMAEDRPCRRDDPYALSKVVAEETLALLGGSMSTLIVRLFGVFGPGQRGMLVPNLVERLRDGRPVTLERNPRDAGDRDGLRLSMTYVGDLVAGLSDLLRAEAGRERQTLVLNVAGDEVVTMRRLATVIGRHLEREPQFDESSRHRGSDYIADLTRYRSHFRRPSTPLDEAISRTVALHV